MTYDCIIVGRGLMGSAAAKYIGRDLRKVALIGPDEETVSQEKLVFASHYDRARILRIFGNDLVSTQLNLQSAKGFVELQEETGMVFHSGEGCLYVNPYGTDAYIEGVAAQSDLLNISYDSLRCAKDICDSFPLMQFPNPAAGIFETPPSGHINPRSLISAQIKSFEKNGGSVFNETVVKVKCARGKMELTTFAGKIFYAQKVLLAPGAFINFFHLLKEKLSLTLKSESTIWLETSAAEADRLSSLPPLLYKIKEPELDDIYLIRPLQYPDGRYYLKIGANFPEDVQLKELHEISNWFSAAGNKALQPIMEKHVKMLIPSIETQSCINKSCIVCYTLHGKPYIGEIGKNLFVAAGGNGYSAMSSDALGKIAACCVLDNTFPEPFSSESFRPIFA